jgi:hypothetical protein
VKTLKHLARGVWLALVLAAAAPNVAAAQGAPAEEEAPTAGVYVTAGASETIHLRRAGDEVVCRYVAPEREYLMHGWLEESMCMGILFAGEAPDQPVFYFVAELSEQAIELSIYPMDEEGEPDLSSVLRTSSLGVAPGRSPELPDEWLALLDGELVGGEDGEAAPEEVEEGETSSAQGRADATGAPAGGGAFHGPFHGDDGSGGLALLEFSQRGTSLEGVVQARGARAELRGTVDGAAAEGRVTAEDAAGTFKGTLAGNVLDITFTLQTASGEPHVVPLKLTRGVPAPTGEIDPRLVGTWVKSSSYTSGDFSVATSQTCVIRADGTLTLRDSRMAGGGDSGSFDSGPEGAGQTSRWHTQGNLLYVNGQLYARYGFNGNTLGLWFSENGKPEIWSKE